ncbi:MAG: hypothetical protein IT324_11755 [Anaerolineae bacterium]|nr:hypothetical protein [Anaerolineae bacterium]
MSRKTWVVLFTLLAIVLVVAPTMAGWGAGWGSGSVIAFGTVTGLKNAQKNGATVIATVGAYGSRPHGNLFYGGTSMPGIVWCGNPGAKNQIAQGVNPVILTINFSGTELIAGTAIDKNGKAPFNVHAAVDSNTLNAQFNPAVLCPNKNWKIVDFVPSKFTGLLRGYSGDPSAGGTLLTQAVYDCKFPDNFDIRTLKYKEQKAYDCTEVIDQRVN